MKKPTIRELELKIEILELRLKILESAPVYPFTPMPIPYNPVYPPYPMDWGQPYWVTSSSKIGAAYEN